MGRAEDARRERRSRRSRSPLDRFGTGPSTDSGQAPDLRRKAGPGSTQSPRSFLPRPPRFGAWAAALAAPLALLAALGLAAPAAEAQTVVNLVKNTGQATSNSPTLTRDYGQAFTTGSNAFGYKLTGLDIRMRESAGTDLAYTVTIRSNNSSSRPGAIVGTLVNPASLPTTFGNVRFTTTGGDFNLDSGTTYWVVIDVSTASSSARITRTSSDAEDAGASAGWSISNLSLQRNEDATSWGTAIFQADALKIGVHGYARDDLKPTVSAVPHTGDALTVRWPSHPGAVDYDVRYYAGTADPENASDWIQEGEANGPANPGTATAMTITGLSAQTAYRVQVRARTSAGTATEWSGSGGATTGRGASANRAPRARQRTGPNCLDVSVPAVLTTVQADSGTLVQTPIVEPTDGRCASNRPSIYDPDGDDLYVTITGVVVEDGKTVHIYPHLPDVINNRTDSISLRLHRVNKHSNATVTVSFKVEDPHGASVASSIQFTGGAWPGSSVPNVADPDDLALAKDVAMTPVVLPAATGGDVAFTSAALGSVTFDHDYAVSGLPAGLSFDPATRTISGTPTAAAGSYTVTYTVDDADAKYSQKASPVQAELDDAATQEFTITIGVPPAQASAPTVSATDGGTPATDLAGGSLRVSWTAVTGATDYDLRYYAGSADPADDADWIVEGGRNSTGLPDPGTGTEATVTGLAAGTEYQVQVRAGNTVEGAWSASGSATTNAASASNNAPRRLTFGSEGGVCAERTGRALASITNASRGTWVSVTGLYDQSRPAGAWPPICTRAVQPNFYYFDDVDGGALTLSVSAAEIPGNLRVAYRLFQPGHPDHASGRLFYKAASAYRGLDARLHVTATDPQGASTTGYFSFRTPDPFPGTSAPRFTETVESIRGFSVNDEIDDWVLPAATGGDLTYDGGDGLGTVSWPYLYRVSGLPPGLSFDPATRTVSGTPTRTGDFEVFYTADDADGESADLNPKKSVPADTAVQRFVIRIGDGPAIEQVRIVSSPTMDADGDGRFDTYIRGNEILFDVEFSEPVAVTLAPDGTTPRMRIDLGADDTVPGNSRKTAHLESVLNGGRTLRFAYKVLAADTDSDGVWVQANEFDTVVFTPAGVTVASADTGVAADLTKSGLPTTGNERAKVDGSKTSADTGPLPTSAAVVERTMTVTFDRSLHTQTAWWDLALFLSVKGAGPVDGDNRNAYQHPSAVTLSGDDTLTLTLNTPARAGDTVTLTYRLAEGGGLLRGAGGKRAAAFRDLAVTNNTAGRAPVVPLRAAVAGKTLRFVFDGPLSEATEPAGNAFTVLAEDLDGDLRAIRGTGTVRIESGAESTVTVTLAAAVEADELASVSYTKPDTEPLRYAVGVEVASFEDFRVHSVSDATPPELSDIGATVGTAKVALYFSEALDTGSVPAAGDFAVTVGSADAAAPSSVAVVNNAVVLTMGENLVEDKIVEVTYTPGPARIRDLAGNAAGGFTDDTDVLADGKPVRWSDFTRVDGSTLNFLGLA